MSQQNNNEKTQDSNNDNMIDETYDELVSMEFANIPDVQVPEYKIALDTNPLFHGESSGFNAQQNFHMQQQMGFQQPMQVETAPLGPRQALTGFDTTASVASHKRVNDASLAHHLAKTEQRRVPPPYLGKPVMLEGTEQFVVATLDDLQKQDNWLAVCDIKGISIHDPNNRPPITSYLGLGGRCISGIHQRMGAHGDHFLYCAADQGDMDVYHITEDGKQISRQSSMTLHPDGYIRQFAVQDGLIASGGYGANILIHQESPHQRQLMCTIPLGEGKCMSSLSLADAKSSVHGGCLRYTVENDGIYMVNDFKRSGQPVVQINTGIGDLYCHSNMTDYLVCLAGLDSTLRVYDIRRASHHSGSGMLVEETPLNDIGAIGTIERNSTGTAVIVTGQKNVLTFRQPPGQSRAQYWSALENPGPESRLSFDATFANLPGDDQRSADTIVYSNSEGDVGVITQDYLFDKIPQ